MALLRSYSYMAMDELTDEILNLFSYLIENPSYNCEVGYEIIEAALDGRIRFDIDFILPAYEYEVKKNYRHIERNRSENEYSTDTPLKGTDCCTIQDLIKDVRSFEDEFISDEDYKNSVAYIKSKERYYLVEHRVDLPHCIKQSLRGIPCAVELLRQLCEKESKLKECLNTILTYKADRI